MARDRTGRTRRTWVWLTVAAVVVAGAGTAIAVTAAPASGSLPTVAPVVSTAGFPTNAATGIFTDRCAYSHEAADDPILAPGASGRSMHHDFFGNTTTDARSTTRALVGGPTTCSTSADASAYWAPVLYQNGTALTPSSALIYWRQDSSRAKAVQTVPVGLTMIAGNESATGPQSTAVVKWTCQSKNTSTTANTNATAVPHDCRAGQELRLVVTFPSCWDGHTLDGAQQDNVVYPTAAGCPADHPVLIPQIVFHTNYPTASTQNLTLSMTPTMQGSVDTEHVDFMNGWDQAVVSADVNACIATSTKCGPVTGPAATPHGGR